MRIRCCFYLTRNATLARRKKGDDSHRTCPVLTVSERNLHYVNEKHLLSDEQDFLTRILSDLTDETARLVYADWLEERGDEASCAKAEFLRLQSAWLRSTSKSPMCGRLRRELRRSARSVNAVWLAMVSMLPIENCRDQSIVACPMRWERLRRTNDPLIRSCDECKSDVRYCPTSRIARSAGFDEPVVIALSVRRKPRDLRSYSSVWLGRPLAACKRRQRHQRFQIEEVKGI
jgi:uncharacterized protein (TIGR02996 family)